MSKKKFNRPLSKLPFWTGLSNTLKYIISKINRVIRTNRYTVDVFIATDYYLQWGLERPSTILFMSCPCLNGEFLYLRSLKTLYGLRLALVHSLTLDMERPSTFIPLYYTHFTNSVTDRETFTSPLSLLLNNKIS